jgi:hypothetical protein
MSHNESESSKEAGVKVEIYNGDYVGTAEWSSPGEVDLDITDAAQRAFFEDFFEAEDAFLTGSVGDEEMASERRDASLEAFNRATFRLAAYSYTVRIPEEATAGGPAFSAGRPSPSRAR